MFVILFILLFHFCSLLFIFCLVSHSSINLLLIPDLNISFHQFGFKPDVCEGNILPPCGHWRFHLLCLQGNSVPMVQHPHMTHLHPLLSYSPEAFSPQRASPGFSPDSGSRSGLRKSNRVRDQSRKLLEWLSSSSHHHQTGWFQDSSQHISVSRSLNVSLELSDTTT